MRRIDLTGQRFGRLIVVGYAESSRHGACWKVRCDCGTEKVARGGTLRTGRTRSCGCLRRELVKHGYTGTPTYNSYCAMIGRCTNPNFSVWKYYGGRRCTCCGGDNPVTVCERWRASFENFLADMGERPPGTTIDRINNDGNYEPGNCRWATPSEQNKNQRPRQAWKKA